MWSSVGILLCQIIQKKTKNKKQMQNQEYLFSLLEKKKKQYLFHKPWNCKIAVF